MHSMKNIIHPICLLALLLACSQKEKPAIQEADTIVAEKTSLNFDWLLSNWIRIDDEKGNTTYETWSKENDSTYTGWGYTLSATDTVFEEHMTLHKPSDQWQLEVITPGEGATTLFTMTQHTNSSFVVENPQHDFPSKIRYFMAKDTLKAIVSNSEMTIDFAFVRQ